MTTPDARRIRAALDARIMNESAGEDPYPLRRRLAYQRMLRRLSLDNDGGWVLQGGYLLEVRIDVRARATKDLDLAMRTAGSGAEVVELLQRALAPDPDGDTFTFVVSPATALAEGAGGSQAWRVTVDARLDGRTFAKLRVDLAQRLDEIGESTEKITIEAPIHGMNLGAAVMSAVDIAQHAAEKFHALCQIFPGARQNTRVKDLLDIILFVEASLLPDPNLPARIASVFMSRDGVLPPETLPTPPASWREDYLLLATSTGAETTDIELALQIAQTIFRSNTLLE